MGRARYSLRPAAEADAAPVAVLLKEAGFKVRSAAGWRWLFVDNPAHRRQQPAPAQGWVLEDASGALHGYLGNILLDYVDDGVPLSAATCTSYYVRPDARAESVRLMRAFFQQKGVSLFLSTTANPASDPIYRMFKAEVPVDESFSEGLVWIAADRAAIRGLLDRRGMDRLSAAALSALAAPLVRSVRRLTGFARVPAHREAAEVEVLSPAQIDGRFDALWEQLSRQPGLQVVRSAAALRWYLSDPDAPEATVLALSDDAGLRGYAAVARHQPPGAAAPELRLLDLVVRPGEEAAIPPLLRRAAQLGRAAGAGFLYAAPCGAALSAQLLALWPHRHAHAHAAHFLRAKKRAETARYTGPGVWRATGLDGDTPFCIE